MPRIESQAVTVEPLALKCRIWRAIRFSPLALRFWPVSIFNNQTGEMIRLRRLSHDKKYFVGPDDGPRLLPVGRS
jgi:hypothetical protein